MYTLSNIKDSISNRDISILEQCLVRELYNKNTFNKDHLLNFACQKSNYEAVKMLLSRFNYDFSIFAKDPLIITINTLTKKEKIENKYKIIFLLLKNNADPTIKDLLPFRMAFEKKNNSRLIKMMLKHCDITNKLMQDILELMQDILELNNICDNNVQLILELTKNRNIDKVKLFMNIFENNLLEISKWMIKLKWVILDHEYLNEIIKRVGKIYFNEKKLEIISNIIEIHNANDLLCICKARLLKNDNITQIKRCCYKSFVRTVSFGTKNEVVYFINKKINVNDSTDYLFNETSPLSEAVSFRRYEIINLLIDSGAIITVEHFKNSIDLYIDNIIPKLLFEKSNFSVEEKNKILTDKLKEHLFTSSLRTKILLKLGAKLENLDVDFNNIVVNCGKSLIQILIKYGNVKKLIDYNKCICRLIIKKNIYRIKKLLDEINDFSEVRYEININNPKNNALYRAALSGLTTIVDLMLDKNVNTENISESMLISIMNNGYFQSANEINLRKIIPSNSVILKNEEFIQTLGAILESEDPEILEKNANFIGQLIMLNKKNEQCPICYETKELLIVHDNHSFCQNCILSFNKSNIKNCPLCRRNIF